MIAYGARLWAAALSVALSAAAQERPAKLCSFEGFGGHPKLAEAAHSVIGYFGCSPAGACVPARLAAGDPFLVYREEGDWSCGYLSQQDGDGPAWVRSTSLRIIPPEPNPPLQEWAGIWKGGEDRVTIQISLAPGHLDLKGEAIWHGRGDVVHTGDFEGRATPHGNHMHYAEGGPDSCSIDLTLIGRYIEADDNNRCGGMNVRFGGIWKRVSR